MYLHNLALLINTEATSFQDIARDLTTTLGKEVQYQSPPAAELQAILQQARVPAPYIGLFTTWASAVAEGMLDVQDATLASFLGREPTTTAQFIAQAYK